MGPCLDGGIVFRRLSGIDAPSGVGTWFSGYIQQYDHWVAFILLLLIGGNMIREALSGEEDEAEDTATGGRPDHKKLFLMAIATSIDALAVGVTFAFLETPIPSASSAAPPSASP